jgi:hypothetical protein
MKTITIVFLLMTIHIGVHSQDLDGYTHWDDHTDTTVIVPEPSSTYTICPVENRTVQHNISGDSHIIVNGKLMTRNEYLYLLNSGHFTYNTPFHHRKRWPYGQ